MLQLRFGNLLGIFILIFIMGSCSFGQDDKKYGFNELRNIDYLEERSEDTIQKLNLVMPKGIENYPLLVWIGGGAWSYGDRNVEMDLAKRFAESGIAVASVGHRLSAATWRDSTLNTGIKHPSHIKDVAAAVKWLYRYAPEHGYDKDRIFIGGFSSGAHLAALLSLDYSYLENEGLTKDVIKGMIPISGTYDIEDYHAVFKNGNNPEMADLHVEAVFGNSREALLNASPTNYLNNLCIPILLICDNGIDRYTRLFEERLQETGFEKYEVIYVDMGHAELWRNLSNEKESKYRSKIIGFISKSSDN